MKSKARVNKKDTLKPDESAFDLLFQSLPVPMFLLNEDRRIYKMTHMAEELLIKTANETQDSCFGRALNCINSLNEHHSSGSNPFCNECSVRRIVSDVFQFLIISAASLDLPSGRKALLYFEDITERRQIEKDSLRFQEELMHMSRVTTMGEFTAALAHELNQPLAAILSNAQAAQRFLASKKPDINEVSDILSDIVKDDKRAGDIITKLRTLLKKSKSEFTLLNINDIIREVISLVRSDIVIRNISLSSELNDKISLVSGDRIQLQQVILNLILNSFEAMKEIDPKRLSIRSVQENNKFITVSVKDSGIGINEKNIDSLFKPFFTTKREGLGMGLSINKAIIESHGGSFWAGNNSGQGATFSFSLPIKRE